MADVGSFGKQPYNTSSIKTFNGSLLATTNWTNMMLGNQTVLTPANSYTDVYIKNDLIVGGSINNPSDLRLKENIYELKLTTANNLLNITPKAYTYINDAEQHVHFGIIAQDLEEYFPNLVKNITYKKDNSTEEQNIEEFETHKVVNYIELIPLLLIKIKDLQQQIDELKVKN
jgi:hypothetical protein